MFWLFCNTKFLSKAQRRIFFPFSLITTLVCWMSPDCSSLRYIFLGKLYWELGHLHLICGLLTLILKLFSDEIHTSPSLQTTQLSAPSLSQPQEVFLVPNFSVPAYSSTPWLLIMSIGGMESTYCFRCARIYVSSWLVSLHSCKVSSQTMSSRPLASRISPASVACFPNATGHINTAVDSGI